MNDNAEIKKALDKKPTDELLSIYIKNDRKEWTDDAFAAIYLILMGRGVDIPEQQSPLSQTKNISPHKMPNILGLVCAVSAEVAFGGSRASSGLFAGIGYALGAPIGYIIQKICYSRKYAVLATTAVAISAAFSAVIFDSLNTDTYSDLTGMNAFSANASSQAVSKSYTVNVDELIAGFPLSKQAKAEFKARAGANRLTLEQSGELLWQLMAEGETLLSKQETEELQSFYWKAVNTLSPDEQMFVSKVNLLISQGGGYSASDQDKVMVLVQKGFSQLKASDNDRFLQLRAKSIEHALFRPQEAKEAFQSLQPQSTSQIQTMTSEHKRTRMQDILSISLSKLSDQDRERFLLLQNKSPDSLTRDEYTERLELSKIVMAGLTESEMKELFALTAEMMQEQSE
ncbi:MAG TPA: hypothetical protein PKW49_11670 [Paludibacteraceae bacterium]|nr:hypothetical protein [Paludibacteraceae bacterium]